MSLDTIDLTNKDVFVKGVPHDWFAELRREAPIFWHPEPDGGPGFWCLTRYEDVVTVNRDNQTFSSSRGAVFIWDLAPEELEQQRLMMLNMDPPMHTRYRRLVNKGFTPRMVDELEGTIRERTRAILDKVAPRKPGWRRHVPAIVFRLGGMMPAANACWKGFRRKGENIVSSFPVVS